MSTWVDRAKELQQMLDQGMDRSVIAAHFGVSPKGLRNRIGELRRRGLLRPYNGDTKQVETIEAPIEFKSSVEILPDGTHKSDKLLRMSIEQSKDVNYLLDAHGYDKNEWELISARSNAWNAYSKQDGSVAQGQRIRWSAQAIPVVRIQYGCAGVYSLCVRCKYAETAKGAKAKEESKASN